MVEGPTGFPFPGNSFNINICGIVNAILVVWRQELKRFLRAKSAIAAGSRYYFSIQYF
ncbi:MAG: hypothetical protein KKG34_03775 [Proteobacteria bacterium]|nr:hypothetical protein [Pseudomonadota bacterium]